MASSRDRFLATACFLAVACVAVGAGIVAGAGGWIRVAAAAGSTTPAVPASGAMPAAPLLATVVSGIQRYYDRAADYRAEFKQTYESPIYGERRDSYGTVYIKKPGKMRWDYVKPERKAFISNGDTLWVYEPEEQQAFKQELRASQLPTAITFLWGKGRLDREFDVVLVTGSPRPGGPQDLVLKLTPKQASSRYKHILFVVDGRSFEVKQSVVHDHQGNTNHLIFTKPQVNTKIPDSSFHFSPPAGTRVVLPSQVGGQP